MPYASCCFVLQSATKKLDRTPKSVEEFVEHLSFLSRMDAELPTLEKEYVVVTRLFTIARDFDVVIEPEDLALYQTLMPSFQHLKVQFNIQSSVLHVSLHLCCVTLHTGSSFTRPHNKFKVVRKLKFGPERKIEDLRLGFVV